MIIIIKNIKIKNKIKYVFKRFSNDFIISSPNFQIIYPIKKNLIDLEMILAAIKTVSYTHLTLPTKA